ncbi:putative UDP-glucuronate decarboxylase [Medicago truncatula]|uniref:Putative UDP-glucuronate decarboxylase n=1 Tax=Medicago truncatula TaxID=3880 RepID=A0A396J3U6_MEDTR|nr:putative UDP-glucuronate decarboxylase [Medicago truncatula]
MVINLAAICTTVDYNTHPLDKIYSNFIDALPVEVKTEQWQDSVVTEVVTVPEVERRF